MGCSSKRDLATNTHTHTICNTSKCVFRSQTVRYLQVAQTWNIIKFLFSASPSTPVSGSKCISSMQCKQEAYKDTDTDRGKRGAVFHCDKVCHVLETRR